MFLQLDELTLQLLILLDGSRDRAALITDWLAVAVELGLSIEQGGKKVTDPATIKKSCKTVRRESCCTWPVLRCW
jgi:hypothetical protein